MSAAKLARELADTLEQNFNSWYTITTAERTNIIRLLRAWSDTDVAADCEREGGYMPLTQEDIARNADISSDEIRQDILDTLPTGYGRGHSSSLRAAMREIADMTRGIANREVFVAKLRLLWGNDECRGQGDCASS